jgi:hypothetical protein
LAAADHIFAAIGAEMEPDERRACEHTHATIRATLSEAEFSTAWSEGAQMTLEQATDYALGVASEENAPEHRKMVTEWRKTSPSVEEG